MYFRKAAYWSKCCQESILWSVAVLTIDFVVYFLTEDYVTSRYVFCIRVKSGVFELMQWMLLSDDASCNILTDMFALTTFLNSLSALLVFYSRPCRAKCVFFYVFLICFSVKLFKFGSSNGRSLLCIAFIYWYAISKRCDCTIWDC